MNSDQVKIYNDLISLGIEYEIIKLLPKPITWIRKEIDNCFILGTSGENYAVWFFSGEEFRLLTLFTILKMNREQGYNGFLNPIELTDGCSYTTLSDGRKLYLTPWPELGPVSFGKKNTVDSLLNLIIGFRKSMASFDAAEVFPRKVEKSLICIYQDMIKYLNSFIMLATHRLYPTKFDKLFLENSNHFFNEAEQALVFLQKTDYRERLEDKNGLSLVINNFSRSNLRLLPTGEVVCLSLSNCCRDLPLIDIAQVLVKTGRSNHWTREWFDNVIQIYRRDFPLTDDEIKIIYAYIAFPWEFYRLTSRYYHNKVDWPPRIFVEKLERLLRSEENRLNFLISTNLI